jgi:hypothetical protein
VVEKLAGRIKRRDAEALREMGWGEKKNERKKREANG